MKIEVLGAGAGLCPELGNVSLLVWNENQTKAVLLDCGCTVYPLLRKIEISRHRDILSKIDEVFISHGHSDHLGSLDMLLSYCAYVFNKKTKVVGMDLRLFLERVCCMDYDFLIDGEGVGDFKLSETEHIPGMKSFACLYADKLFYSGDSGKSLLLTEEALRAEVIVHEVCLQTVYDWAGEQTKETFAVHAGIDDLFKNSVPETRAKTWLAHYAPHEADELKVKAEEYGFAGLLEPGQIIDL